MNGSLNQNLQNLAFITIWRMRFARFKHNAINTHTHTHNVY